MKYCPNCKYELGESKHLAQHVRECDNCKGRYFILETTAPKNKNIAYDQSKKEAKTV